ncbi:aldolase/citrate lyase family protein [Pigmentiphaga soli]|uniref:Aldolase/citrate lyase family protein n=1 Tax=Pigmentiphaga soli TaxID=1007095 RepID=A0ABP8GQS5_9BURK
MDAPRSPLPRNTLAEALGAGRLALAMIVKQVEAPGIANAAKTAGYDAVYVDLEYGVIPEPAATPISQAALKAGITALIRIPSADPACATRRLQAGALGIVVPKITSVDQVHAMVRACKCAPYGDRPIPEDWFAGDAARLSDDDKRAAVNALTTLVVMLESPQALALAEEIAAIAGVDILHIGTTDLTSSMGFPNQFGRPEIEQAYARVIAACRAHGKTPGGGGLGTNQEVTRKVIQMGVRFITAGNEWAFMAAAAKERAASLHAIPL